MKRQNKNFFGAYLPDHLANHLKTEAERFGNFTDWFTALAEASYRGEIQVKRITKVRQLPAKNVEVAR